MKTVTAIANLAGIEVYERGVAFLVRPAGGLPVGSIFRPDVTWKAKRGQREDSDGKPVHPELVSLERFDGLLFRGPGLVLGDAYVVEVFDESERGHPARPLDVFTFDGGTHSAADGATPTGTGVWVPTWATGLALFVASADGATPLLSWAFKGWVRRALADTWASAASLDFAGGADGAGSPSIWLQGFPVPAGCFVGWTNNNAGAGATRLRVQVR